MFKLKAYGIILLASIFCVVQLRADYSPLVNDFEEERCIAAIMKAYPSSDERHQFASAMSKAGPLLSASIKDDVFLASRILSIVKPFLKSRNEKIKVCAEDITRFVKLALNFCMLTEPPEDASCEEVERAKEKASKACKKFLVSYSDFLRSQNPMQHYKK